MEDTTIKLNIDKYRKRLFQQKVHVRCPMLQKDVEVKKECVDCDFYGGMMIPDPNRSFELFEEGSITEEDLDKSIGDSFKTATDVGIQCNFPSLRQCFIKEND